LAEKCARSERRGGRITRRWFLGALSAAGLVLTAALCCEPTSRTWASASLEGPGQARAFRTRPDLRPPVIKVNASSPDAAPGYIFVSPKKEPSGAGSEPGRTPDIDGSGEPVWFHPLRDSKVDDFNFEVQEYRGETVLTWSVGHHGGYGQGEYVIADHAYNEISRVKAGNGHEGDHHESLIIPEDTALFTVYSQVPMDLPL